MSLQRACERFARVRIRARSIGPGFFEYYACVLPPNRKHRLALPLMAMLAAALAQGCGGDGSGEGGYTPEAAITMTAAKPPLSKEQFVGRTNRICRKAWRTVLENWADYTSWQDTEVSKRKRFEEAVRLSLLAGIDFHIFDNIRALGSPPGEEEAIEAIIRPFQVAVELGWKERWRAYSVADVVPHFATYNRRARTYGLDDCLVDAPHLRLRELRS